MERRQKYRAIKVPNGDDAKLEHEKVKLLFDYTKFHIGLYTTLATVFVGVINLGHGAIRVNHTCLWAAVGFVALAGLAGGVIASSLPHYNTINEFWKTKMGPYRFKLMRGECWTYLEHTTFWLGIIAAACAFFFAPCA